MFKITPNTSRLVSIFGVIIYAISGGWALWVFFIEYECSVTHREGLLTEIPFLFWLFEALALLLSASFLWLGYAHFSNLRRLRKKAQTGTPADVPPAPRGR